MPSDAGEAYRWYLRAAEGGQLQAEFNVAVMNDSGRGTRHDAAAAAVWYARAASHGLGRAEYNLGQLYEAGDGVPRNLDEAAVWYQAASAELPAAAERWRKVVSQSKREAADLHGAGSPPLLSAVLLPPPDTTASAASDELVWSAPKQALAVRYFVTIMSLDGAAPASIFSGFSDRSAMQVQALRGVRSFAWRVFTVATAAPHYASTPWQIETRLPRS